MESLDLASSRCSLQRAGSSKRPSSRSPRRIPDESCRLRSSSTPPASLEKSRRARPTGEPLIRRLSTPPTSPPPVRRNSLDTCREMVAIPDSQESQALASQESCFSFGHAAPAPCSQDSIDGQPLIVADYSIFNSQVGRAGDDLLSENVDQMSDLNEETVDVQDATATAGSMVPGPAQPAGEYEPLLPAPLAAGASAIGSLDQTDSAAASPPIPVNGQGAEVSACQIAAAHGLAGPPTENSRNFAAANADPQRIVGIIQGRLSCPFCTCYSTMGPARGLMVHIACCHL